MAILAYYFPSDRPWLSEQRVLLRSSFNGPWLDATRTVSDPLLGDQGEQAHQRQHWMVTTGLAECGFDITIVTLPETMAHPPMRVLAKTAFNKDAGSLRLTGAAAPMVLSSGATGGATGLATRDLAYWPLFRAWYKAHADNVSPDVVYLPYLDYCLYAIGLLGSPFGDCPWAGLSMRSSFHYRAMGVMAPRPALAGVKKALFFRVLRNRYRTLCDAGRLKIIDCFIEPAESLYCLPTRITNIGITRDTLHDREYKILGERTALGSTEIRSQKATAPYLSLCNSPQREYVANANDRVEQGRALL